LEVQRCPSADPIYRKGSSDMPDDRTSKSERNGKLSIPLPFEKALKAATNVPADRLPPPEKKRKPKAKK
jgi:hypothetical protein